MSAVKLQNVMKKFDNKVVLDNLNLEIDAGELVAITGKSGKGKTTILNIIGMLEKPDSGKVLLFGKETSKKNMSQLLREKVAYLFQNFALIDNESIEKNLDVALVYSKLSKKEKQHEMKKALAEVGLDEKELSQKVYSLSGGEQQRVALARALLKPCELVLADEPTGSLDEENRNDVMRLLKKLHEQGKTVVVVTHDPYIAQNCRKIITL